MVVNILGRQRMHWKAVKDVLAVGPREWREPNMELGTSVHCIKHFKTKQCCLLSPGGKQMTNESFRNCPKALAFAQRLT